jgi:predicted metal-dependent HD superfamily phosphohydrolase
VEKQKKIEMLVRVASQLMPKLEYHNFRHAMRVYSEANTLALLANVGEEERFLLGSAALLHDIIFIPGRNDNEEKSAKFARQYLPKIEYSEEQAKRTGEIVLATKMPQNPQDPIEELICDADLSHLGSPDFFSQGEKLRVELNFPCVEWDKLQLEFLKGHKYFSEAGRKYLDSGKAANIAELEKRIFSAKN